MSAFDWSRETVEVLHRWVAAWVNGIAEERKDSIGEHLVRRLSADLARAAEKPEPERIEVKTVEARCGNCARWTARADDPQWGTCLHEVNGCWVTSPMSSVEGCQQFEAREPNAPGPNGEQCPLCGDEGYQYADEGNASSGAMHPICSCAAGDRIRASLRGPEDLGYEDARAPRSPEPCWVCGGTKRVGPDNPTGPWGCDGEEPCPACQPDADLSKWASLRQQPPSGGPEGGDDHATRRERLPGDVTSASSAASAGEAEPPTAPEGECLADKMQRVLDEELRIEKDDGPFACPRLNLDIWREWIIKTRALAAERDALREKLDACRQKSARRKASARQLNTHILDLRCEVESWKLNCDDLVNVHTDVNADRQKHQNARLEAEKRADEAEARADNLEERQKRCFELPECMDVKSCIRSLRVAAEYARSNGHTADQTNLLADAIERGPCGGEGRWVSPTQARDAFALACGGSPTEAFVEVLCFDREWLHPETKREEADHAE